MLCCKVIKNHIDEVKKILDKAKKNPQNLDVVKFKSTLICSIKTPEGEIPLSLSDIEKQYCNHFPDWDKKNQCFLEGPIFYDSLFKKEPSTRVIDIENRRKKLREKIRLVSEVPSLTDNDSRNDIIEQLSTTILQSLQPVISDLRTSSKACVIKDLQQKLFNGKIKEKLIVQSGEKRIDVQMLQSTDIIKNLQNEAFETVIRLFKDQPFARVKEIDNKKEKLKSKISDFYELTFDTNPDKVDEIIQITANYLTKTLKDVIDYLHMDNEEKNDNSNKITVSGFLQRKFNELKQCNKQLDIIREIQNELVEKVLGNYQTLVDEEGSYKK